MFHSVVTVRLVSGSWPPEICGVGDFMANVSKALTHAGMHVVRSTLKRRSVATVLSLLVGSHLRREEIVYISYPTEGYGKSLLPFLLALGSRLRVVLHIHEYGSKNRYCRFLLRRFKRMTRLFFSNADDFQRYLADCGLDADSPRVAEWRVVPTPSNIPVSADLDRRNPVQVKVVHFGQIRPHKGLEQLTHTLGSLEGQQIERLVIGGVPVGYEAYAQDIAEQFRRTGVQVRLNLTPEQISEELASSHVGVFAFPDGADERRGSLIAAMAHGVLCITTHSVRTPQAIKDATIGVDAASSVAPSLALQSAIAGLHGEESRRKIQRARELGAKSSFHGIAEQLVGINPSRAGDSIK